MRDLHEMIIHDYGQVICRETVRFDDDLVVHVPRVEFYRSSDKVGEFDIPVIRNAETDY